MDNLRERIDAFVKHADTMTTKWWEDMKYTHSMPPIHKAVYLSPKWCRIETHEERGGKYERASVYAFVCLMDGFTKSLGQVKAGDIHKPASFTTPAKTARGSVFSEDFGNCTTPLGIVYLK